MRELSLHHHSKASRQPGIVILDTLKLPSLLISHSCVAELTEGGARRGDTPRAVSDPQTLDHPLVCHRIPKDMKGNITRPDVAAGDTVGLAARDCGLDWTGLAEHGGPTLSGLNVGLEVKRKTKLIPGRWERQSGRRGLGLGVGLSLDTVRNGSWGWDMVHG